MKTLALTDFGWTGTVSVNYRGIDWEFIHNQIINDVDYVLVIDRPPQDYGGSSFSR